MIEGSTCDGCARALDGSLSPQDSCPNCGSLARFVRVTASDAATVHEYAVVRKIAEDRDRMLPEKGVVRSESGTTLDRDGRLVTREKLYDPQTDIARERVVDANTGEVIVDKVESMKEKYRARGRWSSP